MSQSVNTDESLLYGVEGRRQQLYANGSNYDAAMEAPVFQGPRDNSSGSGNANAMEFAPPPPMQNTQVTAAVLPAAGGEELAEIS